MTEDTEVKVTAARWRFLIAYQRDELDKLRQQINEGHQFEAKQGNMRAVKHGTRSRRVLWCLRHGSLDEWRAVLTRINEVEDARIARQGQPEPPRL